MPAIRTLDDHVEMANIGTNTHAQIDSHIVDPSAHHTKYTNADAVAAVLAADDYLKNDAHVTNVKHLTADAGSGSGTNFKIYGREGYPTFTLNGYNAAGARISYFKFLSGFANKWVYLQAGGSGGHNGSMLISGMYSNLGDELGLKFATINLHSNTVKDPKNHAASALSGTKKLVEITIGAQSYYFEVYPTKA